MSTYIPSLEKVQIGLEAAWSDAAAPTVQLVGITDCRITPKVESSQVPDKRGTTMPGYIATVNRVWAEAELGGLLTYLQIRYLLDGLFGIDATSPHTYLADLDASPTLQSFNLVYGQPDITYGMAGGIMDRLNIKGNNNGPLTFQTHLAGKGSGTDTLEALTDPAVVVAMGNHVQLYIDPVAGPIGTTEVANTAFSFDANVTVDRKLVWHMGSLNPDSFRPGKWGGSLRLILEMTSAMQDILDAALAQTVSPGAYAVRIKATDSLATSILQLDMAGHLLAPPVLFTDADGVTTAEMEFAPVFSSDATFLSCWGAVLTLP